MNYSIIFSLQERQLCAGGENSKTKEINKELQLTPRSQAILDYVHRSLKNDEGKLNHDGENKENKSVFTPGRKGHAQVSTENDVSMEH